MKHEDTYPPVLSYASPSVPAKKPAMATLAEIASVCFGALGMLALCLAAPGLYYVFTQDNSVDFAGDLVQMLLILLIGTLCIWVAFRWCKSARAIAKQQSSKPDSAGEPSGDKTAL